MNFKQYVPIVKYLRENHPNNKVVGMYLFGSQVFNLNNSNSDLDIMIILAQKPTSYYELNSSVLQLKSQTFKDSNMSAQFMDVKQLLYLASKSNFTVYSMMTMPMYERVGFEFSQLIPRKEFNKAKLAHHLLGIVDNKSQRPYMSAYSSLFVQYMMQKNELPVTMDYEYLMDSIDIDRNVLNCLLCKKEGKEYTGPKIEKPFSHNEVNILHNETVEFEVYNTIWLNTFEKIKEMF